MSNLPLVLVFDDDLVVHQDHLAGQPARFVYIAHADHCVAEVATHRPDLVLMDFSMHATLDGAEAVRLLRAAYPTLPIVGISSDSRMNRLIIEAGAHDGVPKMMLPERFRELLHYLPSRP
jgi:CheY-like chemotaxis protein